MKKEINLEKYRSKLILQKQYLFKIKKLEAKKRHTIEQLTTLQNSCNHDLIMFFNRPSMHLENNGYAKCLFCGEELILDNPQNSINLALAINEGLLSEDFIFSMQGAEFIVINKARDILEELAITDPVMSLDDIKMNLILKLQDEEQRRERISRLLEKKE